MGVPVSDFKRLDDLLTTTVAVWRPINGTQKKPIVLCQIAFQYLQPCAARTS